MVAVQKNQKQVRKEITETGYYYKNEHWLSSRKSRCTDMLFQNCFSFFQHYMTIYLNEK
jgi:hypothetical protein